MLTRVLVCLALALIAIASTQVWVANGADELTASDLSFRHRKPGPRPSEVHGWVLLRLCSITGKLDNRFTEYAYIRPNFIVAIGNPPTSPDPCVAIHGQNGKRLFVEGDMEGIARLILEEADW